MNAPPKLPRRLGLASALAAGLLQFAFIGASARVNQDVLLDLRGRIFRHAQALSIDFHERYTSGRLISRSTTDVESLRELLDEGLQELITVVLAFVYISAMLLWLDLGLGAAALASFVPLYGLVRLYQRRAAGVYAARSTAIAAVIGVCDDTLRRHYDAELRRGDGLGCLKLATKYEGLVDSGNVVAIVHADTSTGIAQPLDEIGAACREYDALLVVDAVLSLGGCQVETDAWNVDVSISGLQKCLGGPSGMAPLTYNDWKEQTRTIESLAAFRQLRYAFPASGEPLDVPAVRATPSLFDVLRA